MSFFLVQVFAVEKKDIKVLYVGGSIEYSQYEKSYDNIQELVKERTDAFVNLLSEYFTTVDAVNVKDYTEEMSLEYDVTVMDAVKKSINPRGYAKVYTGMDTYLPNGSFSEDYNCPTILIAEAADRNTRNVGSKLDWL